MAGAIFLQLDDIKGEATDDKHEEEINVANYGWGMANPTAVDQGAGTAAGRVSVSELSISKGMDKASPALAEHCCTGKVIPKGTLTVQRAGEDKIQALVIEMENIFVSSYSTSDSADSPSLPQELLGLSFKKFTYKYTPQDNKGAAEAEIQVGFDIEKNAKV